MKKKFLSIISLAFCLCLCACSMPFVSTERTDSTGGESAVSSDMITQEPIKQGKEALPTPVATPTPEPESTVIGNFIISPDETRVVGGVYEQDNNLDNGPEAISWIVLEKNDSTMLLLSEKVLDGFAFNSSFEGTDWNNSYVRSYLNDQFYNQAFDDAQKAVISDYATTKCVEAVAANPDADPPVEEVAAVAEVTDKVFLLSYEEVIKYFDKNVETDSEERSAQVSEYAISRGVWTLSKDNYSLFGYNKKGLADSIVGCGNWWLRSNGTKLTQAMDVGATGIIRTTGHDVGSDLDGIRPAIMINLH